MKLLTEALTKFICGLLLVGLLIFLPAGTLRYTYGWLLVGLLFAPMLIAFAGTVSLHDLLLMIAFQYFAKLLIEVLFGTPMAYAAIRALERILSKNP